MNKLSKISCRLNDGSFCTVTVYSAENEKMKVVAVRKKKIVTFILDVSGSMYRDIEELKEFVKGWLRQFTAGDVVQLMWFTSRGNYKEFLQPITIPDNITDDFFVALDKTIDNELHARCLTSFDSPLTHYAEKTLPLLTNPVNSLLYKEHEKIVVFCSDGWHNDGSKDAIFKAIEKSAPHLSRFYSIGFGNGCDENILKKMKNTSGCGVYAFVKDAKDMNVHMTNMINETSIGEFHTLPADKGEGIHVLNFFVADDNKPTMISDEQPEIRFTGNGCTIVSISDTLPTDSTVINGLTPEMEKALYYSSALLLENTQTLKALRIVSKDLLDANLAENIYISNTKVQYQETVSMLTKAAKEESARCVGGKKEFGGSSKPSQLLIFSWLEANGAKVSPKQPEGYRAITLKAIYPKAGEIVNIKGIDKVIPEALDVSEEWVPFHLTEFPMNNININYSVTQLKDVVLKEEDRANFANADRVTAIPVIREYNLLDSSGCNSFPYLTVKLPSTEVLEEGKRLGIFSQQATNLVQSIALSDFPVIQVDWEKTTVDSEEYARKMVELRRAKMRLSIYDRLQKQIEIPRQNRFNPDQTLKLNEDYFIEVYSSGSFAYNPPKFYNPALGANKKPGVTDLKNSNTDFNIFLTFDADVLLSEGGKDKAFDKVPTLNEAYIKKLEEKKGNALDLEVSNWWEEYVKEVNGMNDNERLNYLKMKKSVFNRQISNLLEDLMSIKLDVIYGKKDFSGQTTREFSQQTTVDGKPYKVLMTVELKEAYCGPYVPAGTTV